MSRSLRDVEASSRHAAVLSGQSQSQVAATYGVSQGWISELMARYRAEGCCGTRRAPADVALSPEHVAVRR